MKLAIFSIMIGNDPSFFYTRKIFEIYAKKVGADLIICDRLEYGLDLNTKDVIDKKLIQSREMSEIFSINNLFSKYDRILYLDADILITPNARNIFDDYPDRNIIYMFDEGLLDRKYCVQNIMSFLPCKSRWPIKHLLPCYYNAGVILCSKESNLFQYVDIKELQICYYNSVPHYPQTYINYIIVNYDLRVESIDIKYNRMWRFGFQKDRFEANFIHYAGQGYSLTKSEKYKTIISDYYYLY